MDWKLPKTEENEHRRNELNLLYHEYENNIDFIINIINIKVENNENIINCINFLLQVDNLIDFSKKDVLINSIIKLETCVKLTEENVYLDIDNILIKLLENKIDLVCTIMDIELNS